WWSSSRRRQGTARCRWPSIIWPHPIVRPNSPRGSTSGWGSRPGVWCPSSGPWSGRTPARGCSESWYSVRLLWDEPPCRPVGIVGVRTGPVGGELSTLPGLSTAATESTHGDGRDRRSVESVFETARTTARLSGRTQDTDLIAETGGVKTGQAETARNGPEETAPDCVWTADAKREARPKVRLAQLAAEVSGRRTSPSPRHRVQARSGRRGGLIERWLPGGQRVTPPRRRHLVIAAVVGGVLVSVVAVAAIVGSGPEPEHAPPLPLVQQESVSAGKAGEP